jgi:S1-C subfamily serine protease
MPRFRLFLRAMALWRHAHSAIVLAAMLLAGLALIEREARAAPLDAVVGVRATVPENARTAGTLGTQRAGSGVVIGADGLVLTIGYLILEAISTEVVLPGERAVPAEIVAYDFATGFGLLRTLQPLAIEPMPFGDSGELKERSEVLVATSDASRPVIGAVVVSRREFAGYWEYLLPDAIFTSPPHGAFGGAALIGRDGRLLGIGSLIVGDAEEPGAPLPGNMFVPIDALKPILDDLLATGRSKVAPKPWLGLSSEAVRGRVFITRVSPDGPAAKAGLTEDDVIVAVRGEMVRDVADFYHKVWALGRAGIDVPLTVLTPKGITEVTVRSGDRYDYLKLTPSY